ncbi:hypothetical protein [Rhizobium phage RHph_X2_28B]|uniref:hypothetical protein n=1 Tax=Rhizobium phage RHph_X2_28B TaxID=2836086 RepID=UPI00232939D7|nr:hypothetical protein PP751_gp030 [Rhizobium phage RHph_X2_28B]QWY83482.1 hypothetical protein [Rhizobium phage RHph_X2_28B]QWY83718.1 hypothetical protein [Rhizobium phage RHph_X3_15]
MNAGELHEKLTFGKHKGKCIYEVLSEDPGYLIWANDNVEWLCISSEILDLARQSLPPPRQRKRSDYDLDPDWETESPWDWDWDD